MLRGAECSSVDGALVCVVRGEGHEVGSILREELLMDSDVRSAGYAVRSRPRTEVELTVRMRDSKLDPREAVAAALKRKVDKLSALMRQLLERVAQKK